MIIAIVWTFYIDCLTIIMKIDSIYYFFGFLDINFLCLGGHGAYKLNLAAKGMGSSYGIVPLVPFP